MAAVVKEVVRDSIAVEVGIEPGDIVQAINGNKIYDILDYEYYSQDDEIVMEIQKANGELWSVEIEKEYDEELGLIFDGLVFDKMKICRNRCVFCFVDQLPKKMRKTLYVKDDDYRYSFLLGNFISLTNLSEADWDKILTMRLSPLYISVHCTRPEIRAKIFNNPRAATIKDDLQRLKNAGIEVHTQIVFCPELNDGVILKESIEELAQFYPSVASVGVVPVGLSAHRQNLHMLRELTDVEALETIKIIENYQSQFRNQFNCGFVYAADEFYIKSGQEFPPAVYYDDYCQIENGIGLARIFMDDFAAMEELLPQKVPQREVYIITGFSAVPIIQRVISRLNQIDGLLCELVPISNRFFGGGVSVTGLLTGSDIIDQLGMIYRGKIVIIPEIVFKEGQQVLLDNVSIEDIAEKSGADIITVDGTARSLARAILGIRELREKTEDY